MTKTDTNSSELNAACRQKGQKKKIKDEFVKLLLH